MRWWKKSALILLCASLVAGTGCASAQHSSDYAPAAERYYDAEEADASYGVREQAPMATASESTRARRGRSQGAPPSRPQAASPQAASPQAGNDDAARPDDMHQEPAEPEVAQRQTPLLIYTGMITLAIFDVTATQERAIEVIEHAGGFVATRSKDRLVLRVPAEFFRQTLDELATLGDVIDLGWQAVDVSEEVRDLDIRLKNAMEVRQRLQDLLARAESVEDALAIEAQLERITLEIERILGVLRSLEDRIRYSTIEILFRPKRTEHVAQRDYVLPFRWLNELGVERLMRLPEVGR